MSATASPVILVVDDNRENLALVEATLDDAGYTPVLAKSGEEALRAFSERAPDCVLLDVRMPGMDGFEVCRRLRALPHGPETPIVFLTALRDVDTFDDALRAGADDFLTKPVRPTELIVRINAALKVGRLSAELREHYDVVRHQRDALMRLQLQQQRLTSFLVHDLKNPVNSLDLRCQYALRDKELSERARKALQQIREEAKALSRLILNLLDISQSDEQGLTLKKSTCDLHALVGAVLAELALRAQESGVALESKVQAAAVTADPDLLRRVLVNLVENAIRHAPEGTPVVVSSEEAPGAVRLAVTDRGVGVPVELRERIFEPFAQLDDEARGLSRTGRGLGLTFCRTAVTAHGGSITVEDANPGSSFVVVLPKPGKRK